MEVCVCYIYSGMKGKKKLKRGLEEGEGGGKEHELIIDYEGRMVIETPSRSRQFLTLALERVYKLVYWHVRTRSACLPRVITFYFFNVNYYHAII